MNPIKHCSKAQIQDHIEQLQKNIQYQRKKMNQQRNKFQRAETMRDKKLSTLEYDMQNLIDDQQRLLLQTTDTAKLLHSLLNELEHDTRLSNKMMVDETNFQSQNKQDNKRPGPVQSEQKQKEKQKSTKKIKKNQNNIKCETNNQPNNNKKEKQSEKKEFIVVNSNSKQKLLQPFYQLDQDKNLYQQKNRVDCKKQNNLEQQKKNNQPIANQQQFIQFTFGEEDNKIYESSHPKNEVEQEIIVPYQMKELYQGSDLQGDKQFIRDKKSMQEEKEQVILYMPKRTKQIPDSQGQRKEETQGKKQNQNSNNKLSQKAQQSQQIYSGYFGIDQENHFNEQKGTVEQINQVDLGHENSLPQEEYQHSQINQHKIMQQPQVPQVDPVNNVDPIQEWYNKIFNRIITQSNRQKNHQVPVNFENQKDLNISKESENQQKKILNNQMQQEKNQQNDPQPQPQDNPQNQQKFKSQNQVQNLVNEQDVESYLSYVYPQDHPKNPKGYFNSRTYSNFKYGVIQPDDIFSVFRTINLTIPNKAHFLNHHHVPFKINQFLKYEWKNAIGFGLVRSRLTNQDFKKLSQNVNLYPAIKILKLSMNPFLTTVTAQMLSKFKKLQYINFGTEESKCKLSQQSIKELKKYKLSHPHVLIKCLNGNSDEIN